jgi:uncharacterized Zn-finger protein
MSDSTLNVSIKISSNNNFGLKSTLKIHIQRVHENNKPFKCDLCDYSASCHQDLIRHIECVHENLKQHKCTICQKNFCLKSTLKIHIQRVHENKKPFKCDLCDYSALTHAEARRHIECVHENLKQHQCTICQKSLSRKSTLKMHIERVHENKKLWSGWLVRLTTQRLNKTQCMCPCKTETTLMQHLSKTWFKIYYINVQSPNLDLKLGIGSKATKI